MTESWSILFRAVISLDGLPGGSGSILSSGFCNFMDFATAELPMYGFSGCILCKSFIGSVIGNCVLLCARLQNFQLLIRHNDLQ